MGFYCISSKQSLQLKKRDRKNPHAVQMGLNTLIGNNSMQGNAPPQRLTGITSKWFTRKEYDVKIVV